MTADPTDFESREVRERLYSAQKSFHKVVVRLFMISIAVNFAFLIGIGWAEFEAHQGRDDLRSCIDPKGACAQRSAKQGATLIAASIVCTNRGYTDIDEALACVREVMSDGAR